VAALEKRTTVSMIDVGRKRTTLRKAKARGFIRLLPGTVARIREGRIPKGDVLTVARLAGIMAAKRASDIVPLCHPLLLNAVEMDVTVVRGGVEIVASVAAHERTGVEMEALAAVSAAALTVYDMCKSIDRAAVITDIYLLKKSGGKSGRFIRRKS
jgi:cyclic pyranopterin phosphate synthase